MNTLDLHMHTTISTDGTYAPEDLVRMCAGNGLRTIAITDHNSTRAYPGALDAARAVGIRLIPGVELDCHLRGVNLHVLGYGIDPAAADFGVYEDDLTRQEQQASIQRLAAVRGLGIIIEQEQIDALAIDGVITGEMLAEVALADPRNEDHPLLLPYRAGGSRGDNPYVNFYWDVCAQGKPAYAHVDFFTLAQAVETIRRAGGFAVLAHPGINIGRDAAMFAEILTAGVEGVEAYSSYHDAGTAAFWARQAQERGALVTIGSDFHGKTKPAIRLGAFDIPGEAQIRAAFMERARAAGR